jgi:hypothetical protein
MSDCKNQIGTRNIQIRFYDCDNNQTYGPFMHELAGDTQPTYRLCAYSNEPMPGGYVKRTKGNKEISVVVIRNPTVPLALYQGCASMDISVEHFNGLVVTGRNGTGTGSDASDGHEVTITATFRDTDVDELLPAGSASAFA